MGRTAWILIVCGGLFDLILVGFGLYAVLHSPRLPIELVQGRGGCAWEIASGLRSGPACLVAIEGIELRPGDLVPDHRYLHEHLWPRWRRVQGELYQATHAKDWIRITVAYRPSLSEWEDLYVPRVDFRVRDRWSMLSMVLLSLALGFGVGILGGMAGERHPAGLSLWVLGHAVFAQILVTVVQGLKGLAFPVHVQAAIYHLHLVTLMAGAVSLVHMSLTFPVPVASRRFRSVSTLVFAVMAVGAHRLSFEGLFPAVPLVVVLAALVPLVCQVRALLGDHAHVRRLQAMWGLWGLSVPAIVWAVVELPNLAALAPDSQIPHELVTMALIALPLGGAMAMLRIKILWIHTFIRRTLVGAFITVITMVIYVYMHGTSTPFHDNWLYSVFFVSLVVTFMMGPGQERLEALLERSVFARTYWRAASLARLPEELGGLSRASDMLEHVLYRVGKVMNLEWMMAAYRGMDGRPRHRSWLEGNVLDPDEDRLSVPDSQEFWDALSQVGRFELLEPDGRSTPLTEWMWAWNLELLFPMRLGDEVLGFIASSVPKGVRGITREETILLTGVASSLGLALKQAMSYETIEQMNRDLEKEIEERSKELEKARFELYQWEKLASLGTFAAGVAHELNTPLGVVVSSADQIIRNITLPSPKLDKATKLAHLCKEAARRATDIVQDLRMFSRPELEALRKVDLNKVIRSTLALLRGSMDAKSLVVRAELGEMPEFLGHPTMINQIVTNLLQNAMDAVSPGGTISISTSIGDGVAVLVVEDDGPGIPPEIKDRIFEPFFTTKAPGRGTGLGLSLCYTFVQQHRGSIREEGEPGRGARFVVELPVTFLDGGGPSWVGPDPEPVGGAGDGEPGG